MENLNVFNFVEYLTTSSIQHEHKDDKVIDKPKEIKSFRDARQSLVLKNKQKFPFKTECKSPKNMGKPIIKQPLSKTIKSPKRIPNIIFLENK